MQICKLYFAKTESIIQMTEMIENSSVTLNEESFNYLSCLQKAATPQQPLAATSSLKWQAAANFDVCTNSVHQ